MTAAERGRRIKEARISKKMTQSEVVGDFITRNMLSQIESGSATPSVKTLEYLASVLDIPIAELMPRSDEEPPCRESGGETERLCQAKRLFSEGRYSEAEELLGGEADWDLFRDEFYAVSARCFLKLAEEAAEADTVKAVEYAKKAAELSQKGFYSNGELKAEAVKLLNGLAEKLSRYYAGLISDMQRGF